MIKEEAITAWPAYSVYTRRNDRMASFWQRPMIDYLQKELDASPASKEVCVLDFGCSYFDLALQLNAGVDRFDPDNSAIEIAGKRLAEQPARKAFLTTQRDKIPQKKYDWIIANSVVQYFTGSDDLENFIADSVGKWSKNGRPIILISDIIPIDYSPRIDAVENIFTALNNGFALPMLRHLFRAMTKPKGLALKRYSLEEITCTAAAYGLQTTRLPDNLTPSKQRFSILLKSIQ